MNHHWQDIGKFIVFERDHENIRSRLYKVYEACLDIRKVETDLKVAEAWKSWYTEKDYNTNDSNVELFRDRHRYYDLRLSK